MSLYHIIIIFYFLMVEKMDRIYHGCMTKNTDGTNRLIGPGEKCLVPTAWPFCQYIEDMPNIGVKTRSQYTVSNWSFDTYFWNKSNEDIERWMTAPDSEVYLMKWAKRFYVVWCYFFCSIALWTMEIKYQTVQMKKNGLKENTMSKNFLFKQYISLNNC